MSDTECNHEWRYVSASLTNNRPYDLVFGLDIDRRCDKCRLDQNTFVELTDEMLEVFRMLGKDSEWDDMGISPELPEPIRERS